MYTVQYTQHSRYMGVAHFVFFLVFWKELHSSRTFYSFIYEEKDMCVCRWQIQPATAAAPETKWFHFSNNNTESEMS